MVTKSKDYLSGGYKSIKTQVDKMDIPSKSKAKMMNFIDKMLFKFADARLTNYLNPNAFNQPAQAQIYGGVVTWQGQNQQSYVVG